jgi:uncharacterized phage-associated protein
MNRYQANTQKLTKNLINKLKSEFESFRDMTVNTKQLREIKKYLKDLDIQALADISEADIPWVSLAAEDLIAKDVKATEDIIARRLARKSLFK